MGLPVEPESAFQCYGEFIAGRMSEEDRSDLVHAALVLRWLGVHAVLARSFASGMERHLVNAGILPLRFRGAGQARAFTAGEELELPDLPGALEVGTPVVARNLTRGIQAALGHELGALEIGVLRSGGILAHASLGSRANPDGAKVGVMSDRMGGR